MGSPPKSAQDSSGAQISRRRMGRARRKAAFSTASSFVVVCQSIASTYAWRCLLEEELTKDLLAARRI